MSDALSSGEQPIITEPSGVTFSETPYGIVKRLETIQAWTAAVATRLGKPSLSILDYGCGTGDHVTYPLACRGHQVLGVDFHQASIEEASRRYRLPNLSFQTAEIDELVNGGRTFDLVVCSEVLEHVHQPLHILTILSRLLRPQGGLVVTTPNGYGSFEWLTSLQRMLDRAGLHGVARRAARFCRGTHAGGRAHEPAGGARAIPSTGFLNMDSTHVQFFRVGRLETMFAQSGFRLVERRARTFFCGPYVDVLFRLAPFEQHLCRANNRLADVLPFSWAADWMFLLERHETSAP